MQEMTSQDLDTDKLLNEYFQGRVVRKDLTKKLKQGANVPVYVLEYLLGMNCASDDDAVIEEGLEKVKAILANNFVRPDEAQKIQAKIRETRSYKIIDKVTVSLNQYNDIFEAEFANLGIKKVEIPESYVKKYEKLLCGGIWCILEMGYYKEEEDKNKSPFEIRSLTPIQMPNMDLGEILEGRKNFTKNQWIDALLRSSGMEPTQFEENAKWHLLARMIPLVENNYNVCELGPRGTGKSYIYKEISPYSVLVSGGQTTVANLFFNMSTKTMGLVGLWDVVAFDEVAGINFKDKDGVQILKDYMASGSFTRGKDLKNANASIVYVGNINQSIETVIKTSHLFDPFPEAMNNDSAFFDRMHCYIPGWEIPKMKPEFFSDRYGFIVDYMAEYFREMRKRTFTDVLDKHFKVGNNLNQRDVIAVRKTVSGLIKLIYPNGEFNKEDLAEILEYALVTRRRVKEQLKKIGGMEFYQVQFSYIDNDTFEEKFVSLPEQGGGKLIPECNSKPGMLYIVSKNSNDRFGVFRLETQSATGSGKLDKSGFGSNTRAKESTKIAWDFLKANKASISSSINLKEKDYHLNITDLQGVGLPDDISLGTIVAIASIALNKHVQDQLVVLGSMSIGGSIVKVSDLANVLQVCFDTGAKRILLPVSSAQDMASVPPELMTKFQTTYYTDPIDAIRKALGVE
jgi:ATP-dependent Lon protease